MHESGTKPRSPWPSGSRRVRRTSPLASELALILPLPFDQRGPEQGAGEASGARPAHDHSSSSSSSAGLTAMDLLSPARKARALAALAAADEPVSSSTGPRAEGRSDSNQLVARQR